MSPKKILLFIVILFVTFFPLITLAAYGLEETAGAAKLTKTAPGQLPELIGSILGTGLSLVGILFFALMLYGGLTWMLARGNAEQEKQALSTITAAIIGIVIVLASYAITNFVFKSIGSSGGENTPVAPQNEASIPCTLTEDKLADKCSGLDQSSCNAEPLAVCDYGVTGPCGGLIEEGTAFCAKQNKADPDGICGGYTFCE